MCRACWDEMGSPHIDNPKVQAAALAIHMVDESANGSGYLHSIIDDWNLEDCHIAWCELAVAENSQGVPTSDLSLYSACLKMLKPLSEDERASALAINEGWTEAGCRRK